MKRTRRDNGDKDTGSKRYPSFMLIKEKDFTKQLTYKEVSRKKNSLVL